MSSLDVYNYVFNVYVFVGPCLVSTEPELNVVSSRLRQILTEPVGSVTALFSARQTAMSIPQPIVQGERVCAITVAEKVVSDK